METLEINITEDIQLAIKRFIENQLESFKKGATSKKSYEEARSYAVEALTGLLFANPDLWDFEEGLEKIKAHEAKHTKVRR